MLSQPIREPSEQWIEFDLIPKGAFSGGHMFPENTSGTHKNDGLNYYYDDFRPFHAHYGFLGEASENWEGVGDLNVQYDNSSANEAVTVRVPQARLHQRFVYVLWFAASMDSSEGYWTDHRSVNLSQPKGSFICLPVMNPAPLKDGYLINALYNVLIWDEPRNDPVSYPGRIRQIFYGFTEASRQQYLQDPNLGWKNSFNQFTLEGVIPARHEVAG